MEIQSIVNDTLCNLLIASDYIENYLLEDPHLANNFVQIIKNLKNRFIIKNNKLCNSDGSVAKLPIELSLKNRMGALQRSEIVKVLNNHFYSFEIRMDDSYEHQRIIFFVYDKTFQSIIMTYGFTKQNGIKITDTTNFAGNKTDFIRNDVYINDNEELWRGMRNMQLNILDKLLQKKQPQIYEKVHSPQYDLSTELLKLRTENNLSVEEFSSMIGVTEKEYLDFEFGELNKTIDEYNQLINSAKKKIAFRNYIGSELKDFVLTGEIRTSAGYKCS
ncbi:hypothetical protein HRD57_03330 [Tetragenococcus halophilus]|nr:hypothetical protein [Tetragenococcus halophilus]